MSELYQLISATERWLQHSTEIISKKFLSPDFYTPFEYIEQWSMNSDGSLESIPYKYIPTRELQRQVFDVNPLWKEVKSLALTFPNIAKSETTHQRMYDVGSALLTLEQQFEWLLPTPRHRDRHLILSHLHSSATLVEDFIVYLESDSYDSHYVWPIGGFHTSSPVELQPGLRFRELTPVEKIGLLQTGVFRGPNQPRIPKEYANWFGLHLVKRRKKFVPLDSNIYAEIEKESDQQQELFEDFMSAASIAIGRPLLHPGGSGLPPRITFNSSSCFSYPSAQQSPTSSPFAFSRWNSDPPLSAEKTTELQTLWRMLRSPRNTVHRAVATAVRRVHFASNRHKPQDKLVDLMIAAETLFGGNGTSEKTFRVSLNAALLLGSNESERSQLFDGFKRGYSERSDIVHGKDLDVNKARNTVRFLQEKVVAAIKKIMSDPKLEKDFPAWRKLVFEER